MKNKKVGFLLILWMCSCIHLFAQQKGDPAIGSPALGVVVSGDAHAKASVQGIWQLCMYAKPLEDGSYTVIPGPCLKMISSDNTFVTMMMGQVKTKSFINAMGIHRQTSDSTYIESVYSSISDSELSGKEVEIKFKLLNSNVLMISYQMPGRPMPAKEYWTRVVQQLPNVGIESKATQQDF